MEARRRLQAESFQENLQNKLVGREQTILQILLNNHVEQFSVPTFCGSFWKFFRESPSSWWCLVVPLTRNFSIYLSRSRLNSVWFSAGSELLCWFETKVLGFDTEICQRSWLRNIQYQRKQNWAQRRGKKRMKKRRLKRSETLQFLSLLIQIIFCFQNIRMLKCTSTIGKFTTLMVCIRTSSTLPTFSRSYLWIQGRFKLRGVRLWKSS